MVRPVPLTGVSATSTGADFGTNSWLVEEMYEQFRNDPASVGEAWQEFFADYKSTNPALQAHASAPSPADREAEAEATPAEPSKSAETQPRTEATNGPATTVTQRAEPDARCGHSAAAGDRRAGPARRDEFTETRRAHRSAASAPRSPPTWRAA